MVTTLSAPLAAPSIRHAEHEPPKGATARQHAAPWARASAAVAGAVDVDRDGVLTAAPAFSAEAELSSRRRLRERRQFRLHAGRQRILIDVRSIMDAIW